MTLPRREWFLAASLQLSLLLLLCLAIISCGAYGCILVSSSHDYMVIAVCALHPFTWSWSLHPVIIEATPLVHVKAAPQLMVQIVYYSYDTYGLVAIFQLYYVILYITLLIMFLMALMFYMSFYEARFTASTIFSYYSILDFQFIHLVLSFRLPCHCWVPVHCVFHICMTMSSILSSPLYHIRSSYLLWPQFAIPYMISILPTTLSPPYHIYDFHTTYDTQSTIPHMIPILITAPVHYTHMTTLPPMTLRLPYYIWPPHYLW